MKIKIFMTTAALAIALTAPSAFGCGDLCGEHTAFFKIRGFLSSDFKDLYGKYNFDRYFKELQEPIKDDTLTKLEDTVDRWRSQRNALLKASAFVNGSPKAGEKLVLTKSEEAALAPSELAAVKAVQSGKFTTELVSETVASGLDISKQRLDLHQRVLNYAYLASKNPGALEKYRQNLKIERLELQQDQALLARLSKASNADSAAKIDVVQNKIALEVKKLDEQEAALGPAQEHVAENEAARQRYENRRRAYLIKRIERLEKFDFKKFDQAYFEKLSQPQGEMMFMMKRLPLHIDNAKIRSLFREILNSPIKRELLENRLPNE